MGDHEQRAGVVAQPFLQPNHRIEIEMVRRLIEQQQIGPAHQRLRDIETHAPTTGERAHGASFIVGIEAKTVHQACRTAARIVAADGCVMGMQFGERVRRRSSSSASAIACSVARSSASPSITNSMAGWSSLPSSCDTCARTSCAGRSKLPASGCSSPSMRASKLDLPRAVGADDADFLAAIDRERDILDQQPSAAA